MAAVVLDTLGVAAGLAAIWLGVRWELRERRRIEAHRERIAARWGRRDEDVLWAVLREQEADVAVGLGIARTNERLRAEIADALLADIVGLPVKGGSR